MPSSLALQVMLDSERTKMIWRSEMKRFFTMLLPSVVLGAVAAAEPVPARQDSPCPEFQAYLAARASGEGSTEQEFRAFASTWIDRLTKVMDQPGCGRGMSSARYHAAMLAGVLEDWPRAKELASAGLALATDPIDRALWQERVADAAFRLRNTRGEASRAEAIREIDIYIALAPAIDRATYPKPAPGEGRASLWQILISFQSKAQCQREGGDFVAAAATEQCAVTTFLSRGVTPEPRHGSFLPEESLYRASIDYLKANRPREAAEVLRSIRMLAAPVRPAGLHTYIAIASAPSPQASLDLLRSVLVLHPTDDWTPIQVLDAAIVTQGSGAPRERLQQARDAVQAALNLGDAALARADKTFRDYQQSVNAVEITDQAEGFQALLLRERARLELDLGDRAAARQTLAELQHRAKLTAWCAEFSSRLSR